MYVFFPTGVQSYMVCKCIFTCDFFFAREDGVKLKGVYFNGRFQKVCFSTKDFRFIFPRENSEGLCFHVRFQKVGEFCRCVFQREISEDMYFIFFKEEFRGYLFQQKIKEVFLTANIKREISQVCISTIS